MADDAGDQGGGRGPVTWDRNPVFLGSQYRPGQSGNPSGRRKNGGRSLTETLQAKIEEECPFDVEHAKANGGKLRTWRELIILALLRKAAGGSNAALKEVFLRMDGAVKLNVSLSPGDLGVADGAAHGFTITVADVRSMLDAEIDKQRALKSANPAADPSPSNGNGGNGNGAH